MSRFYIPSGSIKDDKIQISGKEAHHILNVMRLKVSDEITVFDGTGTEYTGIIEDVRRNHLGIKITQKRNITSGERFDIALIQSVPKKNKMGYIVEKATELGVNVIIPVITARTIPEWSEAKKGARIGRWEKIAQEAAKQSGRTSLPSINPLSTLQEALKYVNGYDMKLIAVLNEKTVKLKDILRGAPGGKIAIAIGPEGDFTAQETEEAQKLGFKAVTLGPRVLKSDTAALAVISMVNYEYQ